MVKRFLGSFMLGWFRVAQRAADASAWLKAVIIALLLLAEAFVGLAVVGRLPLPLPLPPTVLMLAPLALCLVALFLLHFESGIAVTVLAFLSPLTVFSFASFSFGVMPFLVVLLFALYLARAVVKERRFALGAPGALPLLLLVGVSIASVAYAYIAQDPRVPRGREWSQGHWWVGYQAMGVFLFAYTWVVYVVAANGLRSKGWLWAVYGCALVVCTYVVVIPLPGYVAAFRGFGQLLSGERLTESASGTAAMLLALLSLALLLYVRRPVVRLVAGLLLALALLNLVLSYFLNTWLGFLAGAAVLILKRSKRVFLIWLVVLLIAAVLGAELFLLIYQDRFKDPQQGDMLRLEIWRDTLRVWQKRPLIGVGNANLAAHFLVYGTGQTPGRILRGKSAHPHNIYLGILAENGLLGLACMLWLIAVFVRSLWRSMDNVDDEELQGLAAGGLAVFVAGATTALFASGLLPIYSAGGAGPENVNGMVFTWIIYGLGVAATRVERWMSA
ncbi:MAG: O-antigen ligase family protein [Anaerolineae bacterium]|nr:O-antigen ligase family protein [Anaerolineae bacterium]